ncbi:MAG: DUF2007 domain-containing protein [Bacteroidales bacterium]|jgi:hypothetical protein|nr:DUF2007 domain-containing protein [Bacteroidales bacterium]
MNEPESKPVRIFAGSAWEASLVKSLLEDADIQAFLQDESLGMIAPWYAAPGGAGAVKVIVSSADYDLALLVVTEYLNNMKED